MKSYVSFLQGLYQAMFSDIVLYLPSLRRDCERDASRLLSLVDTRGLSYLMIDLPAAGKHFDKCLSAERLTPFCMPGFRAYRRGVAVPRLFKGLLLRVFDDVGMLRVNPDVMAIRYLRQLFYAAKKVKVPCDDSRTWEHVHEFFAIDREIDSASLNWEDDRLRLADLRDLHFGDPRGLGPAPLFPDFTQGKRESLSNARGIMEAVQRTADIISSCLGVFNPLEWRTKHGPGAVADQRHTQFKYDFPTWPAKLENVFPMADFGFANFSSWAEFSRSGESQSGFSPFEFPSRLIAVPKTLKGPRLIASEPVSHQWCQQSIKDYLTTRIAKTPISKSIHFRDQTENQVFAKRASHTQSHVTVDLSSASDRLSCWVVERLFRRLPSLVEALHASRTRWVVNTIDRKSPQYHKLRKFACMGSACTFPVQSYAFTTMAVASILYSRGLNITISNIRRISREVRVFGDDIIIPEDGWEVLQGVLSHLGLEVNQSKTFASGRFRESCGFDAWDGQDVTPTYTMTYPEVSRPESVISSVATHNNMISHGYYRAADYIKTRVMKVRRFRFPFVPTGSGLFGWYDDFSAQNSHLRRKWDPALQKLVYLVDSPSAKSIRLPVERDSALLQYFTEAQSPPLRNDERIGRMLRPTVSIRRRWVSIEDKIPKEIFYSVPERMV
ncbi:MAG: putative replicase protein [Alehxovirus faecivicinum]|uniref:RNA-directed RNA polymerase n=1 Tax=Leviviridae sp. TaxID=2027243 RepID=A0ABY3SS71_9VIRU|nr:MAG: putative replicase protein [Leviviridae sp.]